MNILLDECLDWRLGRDLPGHSVKTVQDMGWQGNLVIDPVIAIRVAAVDLAGLGNNGEGMPDENQLAALNINHYLRLDYRAVPRPNR